jgi:hypothetical protein
LVGPGGDGRHRPGLFSILALGARNSMVKTAQQALDNYKSAMASPQTQANYKAGVSGYAGNPMQLAAAAAPKWAANTAAAQPKFEASLNSTPKAVWVNNSVQVGAPRLATGATKAANGQKMQSYLNKYAPLWGQMGPAAAAAGEGGGAAGAAARWQAAASILMTAAGTA